MQSTKGTMKTSFIENIDSSDRKNSASSNNFEFNNLKEAFSTMN
jgi:hypothetical protein